MAICKAAVNQSNLANNMNQFLTNHWLGHVSVVKEAKYFLIAFSKPFYL